MFVPAQKPTNVPKPWSNRTRVFARHTYSGRVVYDRPHHLFTLADLDRIARSVKIYTDPKKREEDFIVRLIRLVFKIIFAIIPVPGILEYLEDPFVDFYAGVLQDSRQVLDQGEAFKERVRSFIEEVIKVYSEAIGEILVLTEET